MHVDVQQPDGRWQTIDAATAEYAANLFEIYKQNGERCRLVNDDGTTEEHLLIQVKEPEPPTNTIDLSRTRVIVTAWPDNRWPVEIINWIEQLFAGVDVDREQYRVSVKKQDRTCARNTAVLKHALQSPYDWFIFVDSDVRPGSATSQFLKLDADIKCCEVPMRTETAWCWPHSFHESLWCTSRRVLEGIKAPWFMQRYNEDGTELDGCLCQYFRDKALAAGFSISHGGWAKHDLDGSWC